MTAPAPPVDQESGETPLEPMDPQVHDIQPGGGVILHLERAWGSVRRCWLRTFRRGYVERMKSLRQGDHNPCPHDVLDPRDLKHFRNQGGWHWDRRDDPFRWRDNIPFARDGLAELIVFSVVLFGGAAVIAALLLLNEPGLVWQIVGWLAVAALGIPGVLIVWFFRDPPRRIPAEPGHVVSPADGKVVAIFDVDHDEFVGGPAVVVGIFLSIFNVHINRAPVAARVIGLEYRPGKCLNALRPESARENERLSIRIESRETPGTRMIVRQITGALARRIVCFVKPGDDLDRGAQFGMIKLGSRTELVLPRRDDVELLVEIGDTIRAGSTSVARISETRESS